MTYPLEQFVDDYRTYLSRSDVLATLSAKHKEGMTKAFFSLRYQDPSEAEEKMKAVMGVLNVIATHEEEFAKLGYVKTDPATQATLIQDNLLCALHQLAITKGKTELTMEEIMSAADLFDSRN